MKFVDKTLRFISSQEQEGDYYSVNVAHTILWMIAGKAICYMAEEAVS